MFDTGGGFGVAVAVAPLDLPSWPDPAPPPGGTTRPSRLGDVLPVATRSEAEIVAELARVIAAESALAAYKAELVVGLAARRPDSADRMIGAPGSASDGWMSGPGREPVPGVSEFFADELALVLNCSRTAASVQGDLSWVLVERLPATWAALADGELDRPRAFGLAAELSDAARVLEPAVLRQIEAAVLPQARRVSVTRLRTLARAELQRLDAAAADRRRKRAQKSADVTITPMPDGMAELRVFLPQPAAAALHGAIDGYARMAKADGDPSPIGQLRVGVLGDLVLRPWDESRPPVTAHLTVLADLGTLRARGGASAAAAEVDGQPITAAHLRELLEQLDALCPGGLQAPAGGTLHLALTHPISGALRAVVTRAELERLARRGCPDHPDGTCECPLLHRPADVDRYRPSPAQRRFLRTRDRTCRHPGCRTSVARTDLDHVVPHADGGATSCRNLCCLCRRHHRLKTHASGWRFTMTADGALTVTTPSGVSRVTRPPGSRVPDRSDDDPPPF
ncbi:HNH endonuclease signature motif containing protein [Candidatus Blastococcus massiliensis]|uniref:HNH endonuclease signature motif containing protein n=1 Tax=Candidatus Blastococcus massiliensis TaxID=1470358 RepID=UPI0004B94A56|nr:HNH endonuclease signature motif containing protein [Candidatus Blastococcus massiliensis]